MLDIRIIIICLLLFSLLAFYMNYNNLGLASLLGATVAGGVWYFRCGENGILSSELCSMTFSSSLSSAESSLN